MDRPATSHRVVIIGGGAAGISVAARLRRALPTLDVAIIEPSRTHHYQPLWTLVGAGVLRKETTERAEAQLIPPGVRWVQDAAVEILPERNQVRTRDGQAIGYAFLVVAPGIQLNWERIHGLRESVGRDGVCSNYSYQTVDSTWESIRNFTGGTALFTQPGTPVKCAGAPQKIMYLADDWFRRAGVREHSRVIFATATDAIFGVPRYAETLRRVIARKGIEVRFRHELLEVRAQTQEAIFRRLDTGETTAIRYDLLHVTPPMSAPDFVRQSPLANADGWVEVDRRTLRHVRYPNVFGIGDASSLPTSKTAAAVRKQAPVLVANLLAAMKGEPLPAAYDGYTSCPLITGYGKLVLAEFDYDKKPQESFPFDQSQERRSMYLLKRYGLPMLYWHGMLKGRA